MQDSIKLEVYGLQDNPPGPLGQGKPFGPDLGRPAKARAQEPLGVGQGDPGLVGRRHGALDAGGVGLGRKLAGLSRTLGKMGWRGKAIFGMTSLG